MEKPCPRPADRGIRRHLCITSIWWLGTIKRATHVGGAQSERFRCLAGKQVSSEQEISCDARPPFSGHPSQTDNDDTQSRYAAHTRVGSRVLRKRNPQRHSPPVNKAARDRALRSEVSYTAHQKAARARQYHDGTQTDDETATAMRRARGYFIHDGGKRQRARP